MFVHTCTHKTCMYGTWHGKLMRIFRTPCLSVADVRKWLRGQFQIFCTNPRGSVRKVTERCALSVRASKGTHAHVESHPPGVVGSHWICFWRQRAKSILHPYTFASEFEVFSSERTNETHFTETCIGQGWPMLACERRIKYETSCDCALTVSDILKNGWQQPLVSR